LIEHEIQPCASCNQRKQDGEPIAFLQDNYRNKLITQQEYFDLKQKIEELLAENI
jgi:hypothetical protein